MLATLTLFLGLPLVLASEPLGCSPLIPVTFDNSTIPELLGQWFYIAGASAHTPHLADLRTVSFEAFYFSPGSREDELNFTVAIRMNDTCVVRNSSKVQIFHENSTLVHVDHNEVTSVGRLIQSDKHLLILNHTDFPVLTLSARTPNVSKENMDEFKSHLQCLGFTEEQVFYTSSEYACSLPMAEENADPQLE